MSKNAAWICVPQDPTKTLNLPGLETLKATPEALHPEAGRV